MTPKAQQAHAMSPSDLPVEVALSRASGPRRAEADTLLELFGDVTGQEPAVWAGRIIGYGEYDYNYDSGRTGRAPELAFASGPREHTLYLVDDAATRWHGATGAAEAVDYGAVKNILNVLAGRRVRVALMTAIGVTVRSEAHDWKRRGERLVRASGNAYTIVRPGWFDYNDADELSISMLQGDERRAGSPEDGAISRRQLAKVLVDSLASHQADHLTFELVAERGQAQDDLEPLFEALEKDRTLDGIRDLSNLPVEEEPANVRSDLSQVAGGNRDR